MRWQLSRGWRRWRRGLYGSNHPDPALEPNGYRRAGGNVFGGGEWNGTAELSVAEGKFSNYRRHVGDL